MRLTSLLILLAIVGGGLYVVFFTDWLKKGKEQWQGYHDAKSPQEAMDLFRKAIQERNYEVAAKYTTKDYGEQLKRAHKAAHEMGTVIDSLNTFMEPTNSAYQSEKCVTALNGLDPFPHWFKVKDAPKEDEKDKNKAVGSYAVEPPSMLRDWDVLASEFKTWDPKMMSNPLIPKELRGPSRTIKGYVHDGGLVGGAKINLVKEGEAWKLSLTLEPTQAQAIGHYIDKHMAYYKGLSSVRSDAPNLRDKAEFQERLLEAIRKSK